MSLPEIKPTTWKSRGPAFLPTEPWEEGGLRNFTSSSFPLGDGNWRLWYYARTPDRRQSWLAMAEGIPGKSFRKIRLEASPGDASRSGAEATLSNLPEGWQPVQPVCLALPGGGYRLYFWAHAPGIVRYLCAESSDGRHFTVTDPSRAVLYHYHDRAVETEALAEGLTLWGRTGITRPPHEPAAAPDVICNDATNIYVLPDGSYELYSAAIEPVDKNGPRFIEEDNAAGFARFIVRLSSRDGLTFGDRRRVLEPDAQDAPGLQFYYLSVTYIQNKRFGVVGHYRVDHQTLAMERVWSEDGITWKRPDRRPFIEPGFCGVPDHYGASASHNLVQHDGRWHCFYTGFNYTHNFRRSIGPVMGSVLLAECPELALPWNS